MMKISGEFMLLRKSSAHFSFKTYFFCMHHFLVTERRLDKSRAVCYIFPFTIFFGLKNKKRDQASFQCVSVRIPDKNRCLDEFFRKKKKNDNRNDIQQRKKPSRNAKLDGMMI
mmetsp:Transcript_27647/g.41414  ORF Transcript_27647/g.41414 Transcript_27647/m.41414 type:complete len:113 (-) Transcript_27647:14-352(-)